VRKGNYVKRITAIIIILANLLTAFNAYGAPPEFSGGVNNENEYEELVFITGEPIKFKGEYKVSEKVDDKKKEVTYTFNNLKPEDTSIDGKLKRTVKCTTEYIRKNDKGQTVANTSIQITETIQIGKDKYTLKRDAVQFSKSDIIDNRPASDFYSGNFKIKKQYTINNGEGTVVLVGTGVNYGYQNFWGNTETQLIDYTIDYNRKIIDEDDPDEAEEISWSGTVSIKASDSSTKSLKYSENEANFSSFNGGYIRVTNGDMVSEYTYDLPKMEKSSYGYNSGSVETALPNKKGKRKTGSEKLSKSMLPQLQRLVVPKFKDTGGHWAQSYIEKLYSLEVFEGERDFFLPETPMTRQEFAQAVVKACDIRLISNTSTKSSSRRKKSEEPLFTDVNTKDPDYEYISQAVNKGIIQGRPDGTFAPMEPLTRAQAVTILIRALGFENRAPSPGYVMNFRDESQIPNWAKDSIYVAVEIGVLKGDEQGNINAEKVMSRAEASAMLVRFLEFLEKDLQRDYREEIIYFN